MVELKKIKKGQKEYFYLVHSYREGKAVKKKQFYLGREIPKDFDKKKKEFMQEFYKEKYLNDLDKIRKNFDKEYRFMPISARKKAKETFATRFTYNTQRIEGSTLSLKDTANLLERGITPDSKPINDVKEAESHKKLFFKMLDYEKNLTFQIILQWHNELMKETKPSIAGKVRNHSALFSQSKFKPTMHIELDFLLKEFFDWYKKEKDKIHPVELAALVHLKFVTIHPFGDGNGRISRLMMNFVLKKFGFPMLDISYLKRNSYYNALERSQVKKESSIFVQWLFRRYLNEYKNYF